MKRTIILTAFAVLLSAAVSAQESFSYTVTRVHTRTLKINWLPQTSTHQRYTVGVNVAPLVNLGMKFDFEYELPRRRGEWIQAGLIGYIAPPREHAAVFDWNDDGNNHYTPGSSWEDFNRMWGAGVSVLYKKMFHRRGWYFSTGLALEYFRVGRMEYGYIPFEQDGLTFYERGEQLNTQSYVKPSVQFNIGKHFAVSHRCFFDLFAGFSASYSIYDRDRLDREYRGHYYHYNTMYGFAYRGLDIFHGGVRFGVLLWDKK